MKLRLPVVAAMFLGGCVSQQPLGSSETYNRDSYECTREAIFADVGTQRQVFDNCTKARGYKRVDRRHTGTTGRREVCRHLKQVGYTPGRRTSPS
jgi:hypothetical protein